MVNAIQFPNYVEYCGEYYLEIHDLESSRINKDRYFININGQIYDKQSKRLLQISVNKSTGYCVVRLYTDRGLKNFLVHRLLLMTYNPIPDSFRLQVNHIDGIKTHNTVSNLEWVTIAQNTHHAQEHGLNTTGEQCSWSILTEAQVREICELASSEIPFKATELAKKYGVAITTIGDILRRETWKDVSKDYDFNYKIRERFNVDEVETMCQIFEQNKGKSFTFLYYLVIYFVGLPDNPQVRKRIYHIYKRENCFDYITSKYDF